MDLLELISHQTENTLKDFLNSLGIVVKNRRHGLGISQEELAYRSGLHRTYVTDIERGARNVTLDSITKLSRALDVPLAELFANAEAKPVQLKARRGKPEKGATLKPVDILLVEENPKHAQMALQALENNGVANRIVVAQTGEEALELLLERKAAATNPLFILLSLTLPEISGIEVLRRIRSHERTRAIPVVILTEFLSDQDQNEIMELGVNGYVNKPVDFIELSAVMPKIGLRWILLEPA